MLIHVRRRSFLTRAYPIMKKNNPTTPIMLREAQGTLPKVYARYGPSPRRALAQARDASTDRHGSVRQRKERVITRYGLAAHSGLDEG